MERTQCCAACGSWFSWKLGACDVCGELAEQVKIAMSAPQPDPEAHPNRHERRRIAAIKRQRRR